MMNIVVGAGKWGSAISDLIAQKNKVFLYSRNESKKSWNENIIVTNNIVDILDSQYLFVAIPAQQIREFFSQIKNSISKSAKVVLCAKGIEMNTGKLLSDVIKEILPKNKVFILSGPNFSNEVMNKAFTISTIACDDIEEAYVFARSFNTEYFKFIPSEDIIATQVFGALKNVLAIACGVVRGLEVGENAIAAVLTMGVNEVIKVARKLGSKNVDVVSAAGVGDIFLSCSSSTSRNNEFGILLAQGKEMNVNTIVEGRYTILALSENYYELVQKLPILYFIYQLVTNKILEKDNIKRELLSILNQLSCNDRN